MKRLFKLAILSALLLLATIRWAPLSLLQKLPETVPRDLLIHIRPDLQQTISIDTPPPPPRTYEAPRPKWETDDDKYRRLVSIARFGDGNARAAGSRFARLHYLTAGPDYVALVDLHESDVLLLSPQLAFIRRWPMITASLTVMRDVVALAANGQELVALSKDGTVAWWDLDGNRQGGFRLTGTIHVHDLTVLGNGDLLINQTSPRPYALARYNRHGIKVRQFGAIPAEDQATAVFLQQGYVAASANGRIALALIYPYNIYFFSANGVPGQAISITPGFVVNPPNIEKEGNRVKMVLRQRIVYHAAWHGDRLYVLVAPEVNYAARWLEVFSSDGELLQRFYLPVNALRLAFVQDDLVLHGYYPDYRLERYRIERF